MGCGDIWLSDPVKYLAQFNLENMSSTSGMDHVNFLVTLFSAL